MSNSQASGISQSNRSRTCYAETNHGNFVEFCMDKLIEDTLQDLSPCSAEVSVTATESKTVFDSELEFILNSLVRNEESTNDIHELGQIADKLIKDTKIGESFSESLLLKQLSTIIGQDLDENSFRSLLGDAMADDLRDLFSME